MWKPTQGRRLWDLGIYFQCSGPSGFGYRRCSISDRSILCRTSWWSLAQEFQEGTEWSGCRSNARGSDAHKPEGVRCRSVDCGSPYHNREGSLSHRNIRSSQRILGRRKNSIHRTHRLNGRRGTSCWGFLIRSGVVVLSGGWLFSRRKSA